MAVPSLQLPLSTRAIDFVLPGVDGKNYSLDDFAEAKGLVVVFTCNHCPYAKAAWPLLIKLADEFRARGIVFMAINPNDERQYPEDSFEVMKQKVIEWGINFPYLRDQSQGIARAYQAQCTPDIYVFNFKRELYYHGRINDNWQEPEKVKKEELREALDRLLAGKEPPKDQHPSLGCSIKWMQ
ncbi:thioredoxin family protein [Candidatus Curtissbacteria bacterium]|nr:thioredoxin family protein [Candidatus Curtissbacteria bacterium]